MNSLNNGRTAKRSSTAKPRNSDVASRASAPAEAADDNDVVLSGTLVAILEADDDESPLRFRLAVRQVDGSRETLDCESVRAMVRKSVTPSAVGLKIRIKGQVRRRFWRGGAQGLASRTFIEVLSASRLR